jgi:cytochrome c-type biogenesis protein
VFIFLGASASFLGGLIQHYIDIIRIVGGILIILLGIHLTGIIRFSKLDVEKRLHLKKKPLHFLGTFLVGMAFAAGWSPCIGPLLGSILILAGSRDTVGEGMLLLAIYSGGLAVPFMLISVFIHLILNLVKKASRVLKYVNPVAGILLIIMGLILIFDKFYLLTQTG